MVQVTERAATALQEMLTEQGAPPDAGVRLRPNGKGGFGIAIEPPVSGDEVIERDEALLLIVDAAIKDRVMKRVVDYEQTDDTGDTDGRFVLR